jgi:hypothetical protein
MSEGEEEHLGGCRSSMGRLEGMSLSTKGSDFRLASLRVCRAGWRVKSRTHSYFGGNTAIASTSNKAPARASCGTPIVVLAGGAAVFTYLSRTSR